MMLATRSLPVMETVQRAFSFALERWNAHRVPLIGLAVLYGIRFLFQPVVRRGDLPSAGGVGFFTLLSIAIGIAAVAFMVGTNRLVLKGESKTGLDYFRFDQATWKCLGYMVLIGIAAGVTFLIAWALLAAIGKVALLLVGALIVAWIVVWTRVSLFFPAVSIGDPSANLEKSWEQSRGNVLRLIGGALVISIPLEILLGILSAIFLGSGFIGTLIGAVLVGPVYAALIFVATIFIAMAYDVLVRGAAEATGVTAAV